MKKTTSSPGNNSGQLSCLLALEDGRTYRGESFGKQGTTVGELVFNTSLSGYQEILTDPSYAGQIITLTYPEIGNYGTNSEDMESQRVHARGLVVRHLSRRFSSWRATNSLSDFLDSQGIVGISGVDTRSITRHIRDKGAMRCAISTETLTEDQLVDVAGSAPEMLGADFTDEVTTTKPYKLGEAGPHIAVVDLGIKRNILNNLVNQGFQLTVYPSNTKSEEILRGGPAGLFLSNGPGDPAACKGILSEVPKLIDSGLPMFGICLGHQLISIAFGARTYKLKFGHRGGNQPVKDLLTGKVEITCQNHGFAVDEDSLPPVLELTHINLNDHSVEGFRHRSKPIFCVQYHPEASPGPQDSDYLFRRFRELVEAGETNGLKPGR